MSVVSYELSIIIPSYASGKQFNGIFIFFIRNNYNGSIILVVSVKKLYVWNRPVASTMTPRGEVTGRIRNEGCDVFQEINLYHNRDLQHLHVFLPFHPFFSPPLLHLHLPAPHLQFPSPLSPLCPRS